MILIVGGLGAGKRDFARRELGVREEELSPVLGPGTQVLYDPVHRLCCQLAERAEAVYRISCGLAIRLK